MGTQEKALVIFSGGQDSTTCLLQAIYERGAENVHTLTFNYGQRHLSEVQCATDIASQLHVASHKIVTVDWYKSITSNALFDTTTPITKEIGAIAPNTFVEGRNALFLLTAAIYAKNLGIKHIIVGVSDTDYSGYPDCREAFIRSMNETVNLAMAWDCTIIAPLQHLSKTETWALADSLGYLAFIRDHTVTCYNGILGVGCRDCPACKLRAQGLEAYLHAQNDNNNQSLNND